MKEKKQEALFDDVKKKEVWREEWQGMPEFKNEDLTSYRKIIVHFRNDEDVEEFAKLIGQNITSKLPSVWFPKLKIRPRLNMRYEDES